MAKKKKLKEEAPVEEAPALEEAQEAPQQAKPSQQPQPSGKVVSRPLRRSRGVSAITVDVFARTLGGKVDKLAGFAFWCKKQGIEKLTPAQWQATLDKFKSAPVAK